MDTMTGLYMINMIKMVWVKMVIFAMEVVSCIKNDAAFSFFTLPDGACFFSSNLAWLPATQVSTLQKRKRSISTGIFLPVSEKK